MTTGTLRRLGFSLCLIGATLSLLLNGSEAVTLGLLALGVFVLTVRPGND